MTDPEPGPRTWALDDRGSLAWMAHPAEWLRRASTALVVDSGTLLVDPVDHPDLDRALAALPPVAGVVTLLDRHRRDGALLAARHGAPLLAPARLGTGHGAPLAVPGVEEIAIPAFPGWREAALWLPDRRLLVVAEALGTAAFDLADDDDALGVHPLLRLRPPARALAGIPAATLAVGHGAPLLDGAAAAIATALRSARRDVPRVWRRALRAARAARRPG